MEPPKQPLTGPITQQSKYTIPILESIMELGGSGKVADVLSQVYEIMNAHMTDADKEKLPSGRDIRWSNHAK